MKKILITGGSGFLGRYLITELLRHYPDVEIVSLSRSEGTISNLMCDCDDKRMKIVMADIRDYAAVKYYMREIDTVIHLAAMKRVDLGEVNSFEATSINILGTMNILKAFNGNTFILMSTDKAVEPVNCYGATKLITEKLVLEKAVKETNRRFMVIRSGNILGSTGSVLDIWKRQLEVCNEITVTDPNMTRFYVSVHEVTQLYVAILDRGENGKIYVIPKGEPMVLKDLIHQVVKSHGNELTKIKLIGPRPGERVFEKMHFDGEANLVYDFTQTFNANMADSIGGNGSHRAN
jgi:UDP-N-acetylglucosamine 4,6-dehydratase/5-epimerase